MASTFNDADLPPAATLQSAARLLGIKFLDHLIIGSPDCEDGRGFVSVVEWVGCHLQTGATKSFNA